MREHLRREDIPWRELAFLEILDALRIVLPPQRQAEPWQPSEDDRAAFEELQGSCKTPQVTCLVRRDCAMRVFGLRWRCVSQGVRPPNLTKCWWLGALRSSVAEDALAHVNLLKGQQNKVSHQCRVLRAAHLQRVMREASEMKRRHEGA